MAGVEWRIWLVNAMKGKVMGWIKDKSFFKDTCVVFQ
jgi:hypothetical protein